MCLHVPQIGNAKKGSHTEQFTENQDGTWRYDDFDDKIPFLYYYLHLFSYKSLYPGCFEGPLFETIPTSMELRFWNQAAVVSTAEIFTLSACTTAGIGGAT